LQKIPVILRSLLIVATPYARIFHQLSRYTKIFPTITKFGKSQHPFHICFSSQCKSYFTELCASFGLALVCRIAKRETETVFIVLIYMFVQICDVGLHSRRHPRKAKLPCIFDNVISWVHSDILHFTCNWQILFTVIGSMKSCAVWVRDLLRFKVFIRICYIYTHT